MSKLGATPLQKLQGNLAALKETLEGSDFPAKDRATIYLERAETCCAEAVDLEALAAQREAELQREAS